MLGLPAPVGAVGLGCVNPKIKRLLRNLADEKKESRAGGDIPNPQHPTFRISEVA